MKCDSLFHEFKKFEGQPVKIYTDDEKVHCGIDLVAFDDAVRILDKCGRTELIEFEHISSVVEPMMRLQRCCGARCKCREDREDDDDFDRDEDRDEDDECERGEEFGRRRR